MSAASPSPPPPLTPGLTRYSPPTLSQGQKPQRPQHALAYCLNGNPVMKNFESFEALSNELNALASSRDDGALVDQVEIKFEFERLRELQCEQLASRIGFGIPLKKLSFECKYHFDLNTRIWEPKVPEARIGDAGLMALLDSIGKNQDACIESLILKNCNIGYLGMQALEIGLRKPQFKSLQILNMKMNPSIGSNIARLAQQLQFRTLPSLTELNLSDCNLNIQGGIVMSRVFSGMTGLKKLNLEHCKVELVSLVGNPREAKTDFEADGLRCLTRLKILELAGNCLLDSDTSYTGATKRDFFEHLAQLTCLETLNLENCRLRTDGIQMFSKQCLCKLTKLTNLNVSVNGLVSLSDEDEVEECLLDLGNGLRYLTNLMSIKFNQGGFSKDVAQALCQAIFELPRPMYSYVDNFGQKRSVEGPIAIDINLCQPLLPISGAKNVDLPWLIWRDDGNSDKWQFWYEHLKQQQESKNKLGTQLMNVVEAMRGENHLCEAHVLHHTTMVRWHDAVASHLEPGDEAEKHKHLADFHRKKASSLEHIHDLASFEIQLNIYDHMIKNPKMYNMLDDVHWPLHCGIQEYFADEVIEHEVVGQGGFGLVKKVTILRNRSVLNEQFCMKTLPYPTQTTSSEIQKRNQLHTEIRCMAKFIRKELSASRLSEVKNGHVQLRQGNWYQFEGQSCYTREFLNNFYCCRTVERSKMPNPQEWQLDLYGNGTCGPFAGPQCTDCIEFQRRHAPEPFEDLGYRNLMPVYGVMFKLNPDNVELEAGQTTTTGQTFSLIMKYVKYGSLMHRLDAGLVKSKEDPPVLRCSVEDWKAPEKMFIGVDDWELKLHFALGIARGIRAMHTESVWHRDLKSSNVLINEYHAKDDLLAIAAAREFGAYPYDIMSDLQSSESSTPSHLASTPRTPNSPIKEICKSIGRISEQCSDHADSLYTLFKSKRNLLESNDRCVAAACVYLAEQANQAGVSCPIEIISSAFQCIESDVWRLSNKLISLYHNEPSFDVEIPVFYACVCDFGLSKPSGDSDADNDDKGSLSYMAPEIFEMRHYKQLKPPGIHAASTPVATTPYCATPTRMASTPQAPSTPSAHSLKEQEAQKNTQRDIWAFGCVLYELATHRQPWHHILQPPTASCTQPNEYLFFIRKFWRNLGSFHGGCDGENAVQFQFPQDRRIPPCLLEAIRLCTQKDPNQRPHDIQIIIKELEKFSSVGSKRARD